ncbi:MAG TPA: hypothetical protein DCF63_01520 [Planctomycetaceae bacterium]|nr:hypothetical protein [Planctomycetaceae bacterium]
MFSQYSSGYSSSGVGDKSLTATYSGQPVNLNPFDADYTHSAVQLGLLSEAGYVDIADSRHHRTPEGKYRQPVAIELLNESKAMVVTKLTGEIFVLDQKDLSLQAVFSDQQRSWTHLVVLRPGLCAAIDIAASQVVLLSESDSTWRVLSSLDAPGLPSGIAWEATERMLYVSGQWSQRLYRFQATDSGLTNWQKLPDTDLEFCGGTITWLADPQLLMVADAFGSNFALLANRIGDHQMTVRQHSQFYEHNIAQVLAMDNGKQVLIPMQLLNPEARSIQGEIVWGNVVSNNLRLLQTESLLQVNGASLYRQARLLPLGNAGDGAGDPTSLCMNNESIMAVTLGGTDRVAIGKLDAGNWKKLSVGMRPVDAQFSSDGRRLLVVNQFSDSLSVIDLESERVQHIQLGPLRECSLAERGERLFFHSTLSHDGWMSCHSCHSRGHTNGGSNLNLTDSTLGTPKRVLSLMGQAETFPYGWTGKLADLESQIVHSLQSTMATDYPVSRSMVDSLAAYVRNLPVPPSLWQARGQSADHEDVRAGQALFERFSCQDCHSGTVFTSQDLHDVGLADEREQTLFNPPSLLGVSQRQSALLHDGRATSIREVLQRYRHQLPEDLTASELDALVAYLISL